MESKLRTQKKKLENRKKWESRKSEVKKWIVVRNRKGRQSELMERKQVEKPSGRVNVERK